MYTLESPHWGNSNEYTQHTITVENWKDFTKLSLFASWNGAMINPQWLELPMSRTNFHGPKDVRAIEVQLYMQMSLLDNILTWNAVQTFSIHYKISKFTHASLNIHKLLHFDINKNSFSLTSHICETKRPWTAHHVCLHKKCRLRSDCSWKSSLIKVYTVCHFTKYFKKLQNWILKSME